MNYKFNHENDMVFITFQGDLMGGENGSEIIESVNNTLSNGIVKCVVDISDIRHINSGGIGVLITILTKFRNRKGELIIVNPSEHVKKLFVITKLDAIFTVVESMGEVKEKFKNK